MNRIFFISIFKSPCLQRANLRSITTLCSLLLDVAEGFCRITEGSTINAFKATEFRSEWELNCFSRNVSSSMKRLPAPPDGRLKNISSEMNNLVIDIIYFLAESLVADISPHLGLEFRGAHIELR